MIFKKVIFSVLNLNTLKTNIFKKKLYIFTIIPTVMYKIQSLLQFKRYKNSLSSTKTRHDVRGGGKKPWKQKGTGKARQGSIRSPLVRGGGISFGPKARIICKKLNKLELKSLFQTFFYNSRFNILIFKIFNINLKTFLIKNNRISTLIIFEKETKNLEINFRNLKNCKSILVTNLTINDCLNYKRIIFSVHSFNFLITRIQPTEHD